MTKYGDSWMILFVVGIMYTEWVSSTKTTTLAIQDLKGRFSSKFADEKNLAFTTDLPNTKKYFSRIAVFE
jgi:hypothetical protein